MGNTYFEHESFHKYIMVARGQDGVEVKRLKVLELVHYVHYARAVRGMRRGLSDHHIVLCKARLVCEWIKRRELLNGARRNMMKKLREEDRKVE